MGNLEKMKISNIKEFTAETAEIAEKIWNLETSAFSAVSAVNRIGPARRDYILTFDFFQEAQ